MKKLARSDPGIDYLRHFGIYAEKEGISEYTQQALADFGDTLMQSLQASVTSKTRLRGIRTESVFLTVVAGIGKVRLIKEEDSGAVFYNGEDLQPPDFRVVKADGGSLLIEVKSVKTDSGLESALRMTDTYVQNLVRYADIIDAPLVFAVFWEGPRLWTLNSLDAFEHGIPNEKKWSLKAERAIKTSRMAELGDYTIATFAPIRVKLVLDASQTTVIEGNPNKLEGPIAEVQISSRDKVLSGESKQVAWKLLWYGSWGLLDTIVKEAEGETPPAIEMVFGPDVPDQSPNEMVGIGSISRMISTAFLGSASQTIHAHGADRGLEPGFMGSFIPKDLSKLDLPLAGLIQQPNYSMDGEVDT